MKASFVLLWLESPVLSHRPVSFNVEMRAKSTATQSMIACLAPPPNHLALSLALCGSRVSTFNRLGASVYGAFIMATEQSGPSARQFG